MSFYVTTSITSTPHTHTHYSFLFFCFKSKVTLLVPHSPIVLYHSHIQRQHKFSSLPILIFNFTHIYLFLTTNGPILVEINPHPQPSLLLTTIFVSLYLYIMGAQSRLLVDSVSIPAYPSIIYYLLSLSLPSTSPLFSFPTIRTYTHSDVRLHLSCRCRFSRIVFDSWSVFCFAQVFRNCVHKYKQNIERSYCGGTNFNI